MNVVILVIEIKLVMLAVALKAVTILARLSCELLVVGYSQQRSYNTFSQ